MKRSIITAFILLICVPVFSQHDVIIDLSNVVLRERFNGYHVDSLFSVVPDSVYTGMAFTGMMNNRSPVRMKTSIAKDLMSLAERSGLTKSRGKGIVLRVNALHTWEMHTSMNEYSLVVLNISFLEKEENGWKEIFQGCASFRKSAVDVSYQHTSNVAEAFDKIILHFNTRQSLKRLCNYNLSEEELHMDPNNGIPYYSVFKAAGCRKGLYDHFYDLRDGFPDKSTIYNAEYNYVKNDSSQVTVSLDIPGRKKDDYPWAFCDGNKYWVKIGKKYYPMEKSDTGFVSLFHPSGKALPAGAATAIVLTSVIAGGLIGGAIAGGIIGAANSGKSDYDGKLDLNFTTANLEKPEVFSDLKVCSRNIFYLSPSSTGGSSATIKIDGKDSVTLKTGMFYEIELGSQTKAKVQIISGTGITYEEEIDLTLFNCDLFIIQVKKDQISFSKPNKEIKQGLMRKQTKENTIQENG